MFCITFLWSLKNAWLIEIWCKCAGIIEWFHLIQRKPLWYTLKNLQHHWEMFRFLFIICIHPICIVHLFKANFFIGFKIIFNENKEQEEWYFEMLKISMNIMLKGFSKDNWFRNMRKNVKLGQQIQLNVEKIFPNINF